MTKNIDNIKKLIDMRSIDWERIEQKAEDLYDFTKTGLDINQWEVFVKGYGKMPYQEFMKKAKKEISFGRYVEVVEAQTNLLENLQVHFDAVEGKFSDSFRSIINITEEKKFTIDQVVEEIDEVKEINENLIEDNKSLEEENTKLRELVDFSHNSYEEFANIIKYKIDDLFELYNTFKDVKDTDELKSFIDAIRVELRVGKKPIEAKRNFILKKQSEQFDINVDDIINVDEEEKVEDEKVVVEPEVIKEKNPFKPNIEDYKNKFEKVKNGDDDYVVSNDELEQENFIKYTTFKAHQEFMFNEDDFELDENGMVSDEEKEAKKLLIKTKNPDYDYCMEEEVDYLDRSKESKARAMSLVQMDMDVSHIHFGINSVQWLNRYKSFYKKNLNILLEGKEEEFFNPTQLKYLEKFKRKKKNG